MAERPAYHLAGLALALTLITMAAERRMGLETLHNWQHRATATIKDEFKANGEAMSRKQQAVPAVAAAKPKADPPLKLIRLPALSAMKARYEVEIPQAYALAKDAQFKKIVAIASRISGLAVPDIYALALKESSMGKNKTQAMTSCRGVMQICDVAFTEMVANYGDALVAEIATLDTVAGERLNRVLRFVSRDEGNVKLDEDGYQAYRATLSARVAETVAPSLQDEILRIRDSEPANIIFAMRDLSRKTSLLQEKYDVASWQASAPLFVHNWGAGGAAKILTADQATPMTDLVPAQTLVNNGWPHTIKVGQLRDHAGATYHMIRTGFVQQITQDEREQALAKQRAAQVARTKIKPQKTVEAAHAVTPPVHGKAVSVAKGAPVPPKKTVVAARPATPAQKIQLAAAKIR